MFLDKITTVTIPMDTPLTIKKQNPADRVVALAGNPNVGKSTVLAVSVIWNSI